MRTVCQGYVYPDTATNADITAEQLIGHHITFGSFKATEFGGETTASEQAGLPVDLFKIAGGMCASQQFTVFSTFIPVTAEEPEAAMAFMNLLYTDPEIMTMMIDGVEGVNYVIGEDGLGHCPEGTNTMTCGWHMGDWWVGNSFLAIPWEGTSTDFRQLARKDLEGTKMSPIMGFTLDTAELTNTVGALTSVNDQYWYLDKELFAYWDSKIRRLLLSASFFDSFTPELLLAICRWRMGQADWQAHLTDALELAAQFGYVRVFAHQGAALLPLLRAWTPPESWTKKELRSYRPA